MEITFRRMKKRMEIIYRRMKKLMEITYRRMKKRNSKAVQIRLSVILLKHPSNFSFAKKVFDYFRVVAGFYTAQGITYQILDDLVDCWEMMAVFMTVSCFLIALTIVLMGIVAKIVIWTLLIVVHVALLAGIVIVAIQVV